MGVKGLWQILNSTGRPVTLESLENQVLAIDVSIWMNQALRGIRDRKGIIVTDAHLLFLFNRICKLLFYRIKPVFVFDGPAPAIKQRLLDRRRNARSLAERRAENATKKLLENLVQQEVAAALQDKDGNQKLSQVRVARTSTAGSDMFVLPNPNKVTEEEEAAAATTSRYFPVETSSDSEEELPLSVANGIDLEKLDITSADFLTLPPDVRHEILLEMKAARRQPSWRSMKKLPDDSDKFSSFQIKRLLNRSHVQKSLDLSAREMNCRRTSSMSTKLQGDLQSISHDLETKRIASEDAVHYVLAKKQKVGHQNGSNSPCLEGDGIDTAEILDIISASLRDDYASSESSGEGYITDKTVWVSSSDRHPESRNRSPSPEILPLAGKSRMSSRRSSNGLSAEKVDSGASRVYSDSSLTEKPSVAPDPAVLPTAAVIQDLKQGSAADKDELVTLEVEVKRKSPVKSSAQFFNRLASQICSRSATITSSETFVKTSSSAVASMSTESIEFVDATSPSKPSKKSSPAASFFNDIASRISTAPAPVTMKRHTEVVSLSGSQKSTPSLLDKMTAKFQVEKVPAGPVVVSDSDDDFIEVPVESPAAGLSDTEQSVLIEQEESDVEVIDVRPQSPDMRRLSPDIPPVDLEDESQPPPIVDEEVDNAQNELSVEDLDSLNRHLQSQTGQLRAERAKEERMAASVTDQMRFEFQELLRLFGIPYIISPGEAEAQCAHLDFTKQTNGTITDDSDVWLFGGQKVYRHFFDQRRHVERFVADDIEKQLGLTRDKLIALSLLTGSDYTEGIEDVGGVRALEILAEFGGKGLESMRDFKTWWTNVQERRGRGDYKPESKLRSTLADLYLPENFPDQMVVEAYLDAAVDLSKEKFAWSIPSLDLLRIYATKRFGWNQAKTDEVLLPLIKRIATREAQTKLDSFFTYQLKAAPVVQSKRVEQALKKLKNAGLEVEVEITEEKPIKKPRTRKVRQSTRSSAAREPSEEV